jgi:hypothetical protein
MDATGVRHGPVVSAHHKTCVREAPASRVRFITPWPRSVGRQADGMTILHRRQLGIDRRPRVASASPDRRRTIARLVVHGLGIAGTVTLILGTGLRAAIEPTMLLGSALLLWLLASFSTERPDG